MFDKQRTREVDPALSKKANFALPYFCILTSFGAFFIYWCRQFQFWSFISLNFFHTQHLPGIAKLIYCIGIRIVQKISVTILLPVYNCTKL